ncbi:kinase-like protein [Coccomyxa subellipsoidea C-169]|uniref:non-specific serine/threonine protein kinase n=1 Tax=Coccomyxa subellipsoidea (strain C-169) TaxID=574566 RepID=I0Z7I2_COCSC|nr:kinase-like protein [Coccomyxa subellipsoidea C-169]EIE26601.1 kinase-like protein [Coccomyxa subellipsoidea C-169]|eukprot:XP_005651145.1 kinase-like protein [Coccomyxa subellipsoidea C-169]
MGRLNSSPAAALGPSSRSSTQDEDIEAPAVPGSKGLLSDKYTLGEELGRGAFGQVFKGTDVRTGEHVAIKQMSLAGISQDNLQGIMGEIDLLKNLNHRNIVKYVGSFKTRTHLYIILEYMEKGSLSDVIRPSKFGAFPEPLVAVYIGHDEHPSLPDSISLDLADFLLACFQKDPQRRPDARALLGHAWLGSQRATLRASWSRTAAARARPRTDAHASVSSVVALAALELANAVVANDAAALEAACLLGLVPAVTRYSFSAWPTPLRIQAAVFVHSLCHTSLATARMFVLRTLYEFHPRPKQFVVQHGLAESLRGLTQGGRGASQSVLVRKQALSILQALQVHTAV